MPFGYDAQELLDNKAKFDAVCRLMARVGATPECLAEAQKIAHLPIVVTNDRAGTVGPNPGKWTRGFNHDAIVSVANPAASKAFGER